MALAAMGLGPATADFAPRIGAFWKVFPVVAAGIAATSLLPERTLFRSQSVVILTNWIAWRALTDEPRTILALCITALISIVVLSHPASRTVRGRQGVVVVASLVMVGLLAGEWKWERPVVGLLLQSIFIAGVGELGGNRKEALIRSFLSANASRSTPMPAADLQRIDRTITNLISGAGWALSALLVYAAGTWIQRSEWVDPLRSAGAGMWAESTAQALVLWAAVMGEVMGTLLLDGGVLRMMGVAVGSPIDQPWLAKDFLDYWRRANTWRYRLMVDGYQRLFMPMGGRWMPLGIVAVFAMSGLHHAAHARQPFFPMLRWMIEGIVCAVTAWWRQRVRQRAIGQWASQGTVRTVHPAWAVLAAFLVIVSHGFLMDITRGGRPTEALIRGWLGLG